MYIETSVRRARIYAHGIVPLEKVYGMLVKRARSFSRTYKVPLRDLLDVGIETYYTTIEKFNPDKSHFVYFLANRVNQQYTHFCRRYIYIASRCSEFDHTATDDVDVDIPYSEASDTPDPFNVVAFKETWAALSTDARAVCEIVLEGPHELLGLEGHEKPWNIRPRIKEYLSKKGWSNTRIRRVFKELRTVFNS